jgi:hypothetical protein
MMTRQGFTSADVNTNIRRLGARIILALALCVPLLAQAVPAFNRQMGQNCLACHAGGQFPELTPYGRMFKLTAYTIGERAMPLSMMGGVIYAKVRDATKTDDPTADFQKNGAPLIASGSLFIAGKVTENTGMFTQITYDNYAAQSVGTDGASLGRFQGHSNADNMDFRYADRLIDGNRDLIFGVSLNNNPSIADPWNSAAAWMQYVPNASPKSHLLRSPGICRRLSSPSRYSAAWRCSARSLRKQASSLSEAARRGPQSRERARGRSIRPSANIGGHTPRSCHLAGW